MHHSCSRKPYTMYIKHQFHKTVSKLYMVQNICLRSDFEFQEITLRRATWKEQIFQGPLVQPLRWKRSVQEKKRTTLADSHATGVYATGCTSIQEGLKVTWKVLCKALFAHNFNPHTSTSTLYAHASDTGSALDLIVVHNANQLYATRASLQALRP